jgi:hypothetical protein
MADNASLNIDRWSNSPRLNLVSLVAGIGAISAVALLLNRETYAIGDDYHFYTFYFRFHHKSFFSAVRDFWGSPFAAGRPVAIPFDVIGLSLINSISDLVWVRYLHLSFLIVIFALLGAIGRKAGLNPVLSYLIALSGFLQPGLWHLFMVTYGAGVLAGMIGALLASYVTMKPSLSNKDWGLFTLCAAWAIFSYQPIWPLILLGVTVRLLSLAINAENAVSASDISRAVRNYFGCFVIVIALLLINYAIVRFGYESPRLEAVDWTSKFRFLASDVIQTTIYPWLYFWFRSNYYVLIAAWISIGLFSVFTAVILARAFRRSAEAVPVFHQIGWRGVIVTLLVATALLPLSLGMYIFTDQAIAFRRAMFASILFWYTAFIMIFLLLSRLREAYRVAIELCLAALVFCALFLVGLVMDRSTQQVAAREWFAAICAARSVILTEPISINRPAALVANQRPFVHALSNNEVQVRTLSYPAGAMLIWLSQKEVNPASKLVSPWNIEFSNESPLKKPLNDWDLAFAKCAAQYP